MTNAYQCLEYTDPSWTDASAQAQCVVDGTWAASCPTSNLLGKCVNSGDPPQEITLWIYGGSPFTLQQLMDNCTTIHGTWQ